jgi:hypothetical protein
MSELDDFLTPTLARQLDAEQAFINGDPEPRLAMWSTQDPVTVFGARAPLKRGWDEVSETFRWLATRWSDCTDQRLDLVTSGASKDLGYMVGFEHIANSVDGVPSSPTPCASPTSTAVNRASGRSSTATPTTSRSIRARPAKHRRSKAPGSAGPRWVRTASDSGGPAGHKRSSPVCLNPRS